MPRESRGQNGVKKDVNTWNVKNGCAADLVYRARV